VTGDAVGPYPRPRKRGESTADLGRCGEQLAAKFLLDAGLEILSRNWRSGRRELDLVVLDGSVVAFVEVKTRRAGPQSPAEALGRAQRRRLRGAAEAWIHAHPGVGNEFRFDVVGLVIRGDRPPSVVHIADAFSGDDC